jgi:hypothetical protein
MPRRSRPIQFSLGGLLIAVALCAAALGIVRWLWHFTYDRPYSEVVVQDTEAQGAMEPTLHGREILVVKMNAYHRRCT